MKVRKGFVANSSSSSYVCDVCNQAVEIDDGRYEEYEFCICVNGHAFCEVHASKNIPNCITKEEALIKLKEKKRHYEDRIKAIIASKSTYCTEYLERDIEKCNKHIENIQNNKDFDDFDEWKSFCDNELNYFIDYNPYAEVPAEYCPICTLEHIREETSLKYLANKFGLNIEDVKKEIKSNFKDYEDLKKYVK